jgi:hypothetical protein
MKRTIGLAALMLTAVAAFAQPAPARARDYDRRPVVVERARVDYGRRPVVVVRRDDHRDGRAININGRRDAYCRF